MNAIELIKEKYNTFNKTQRRIADYILANADACGFMTLHKLAGAAETTDATILSFSRKLGFKGFADMKHSIQQSVSDLMMPSCFELTVDTDTDGILTETIRAEQKNLRTIFESLNTRRYDEVLDMMCEASHIYTFAYDFSPVLAEVFASRFKRLGLRVHDLSHMTVVDALHDMTYIEQDALVVLFSFQPYSQITIFLAEYFNDQGIKVLSFTNSEDSPIAEFSDAAVVCAADNLYNYNSMTSGTAVINILASMFINRNTELVKAKKQKYDNLYEFLEEKGSF